MFEWLAVAYLNLLGLLRLSSKVQLAISAEPAQLSALDSQTGEKRITNLGQVLDQCPSLKGPLAWFTPTLWLLSGHLQTIFCTLANFDYDVVPYTRHFIRVPDGGTIGLDFTPPITADDPLDSRPVLVVSHGLSGGSYESYVRDVLSKVVRPREEGGLGWRGCVVNSRGCANVPLTSERMYNGAVTDDIRSGLAYLSHAVPAAPLYGIGFSLGANQMAKLAGEDGDACPLKTVIPVSAPWDFIQGHKQISSTWIQRIYSRAMGDNMRKLATRHRKWLARHINFDDLYLNDKLSLFEFDSLATIRIGDKAYLTPHNYYRDAGATRVAGHVRIPLLAISSLDDPIVAVSAEPHHKVQTNPWLVFATVNHGGHLGYFGSRFGFLEFFRPRRWIARPVIEWLRAVEAADAQPRISYNTSPAPAAERRPQIGHEMVVVVGREESVGFSLVGEEEFEAEPEGEQTEELTQGL